MPKLAVAVTDAEGNQKVLVLSQIKSIEFEKGKPAEPAKPAVEAVEANPGRPSNGPGDPGEPPVPAVEAQEAKDAVPEVPDKVTVDGTVIHSKLQPFLDMINS
jgi:hypothetical protein